MGIINPKLGKYSSNGGVGVLSGVSMKDPPLFHPCGNAWGAIVEGGGGAAFPTGAQVNCRSAGAT